MKINAIKICKNLACSKIFKDDITYQISMHSVFEHALNICLGDEIFTVLTKEKTLMPYSFVTEIETFQELKLYKTQSVKTFSNIIKIENIEFNIKNAKQINLNIDKYNYEKSYKSKRKLQIIGRAACNNLSGVSPLIFKEVHPLSTPFNNNYSLYLSDKIKEFNNAVLNNDKKGAIKLSEKIAGCGAGLTPSSDDFLQGYIMALYSTNNIKMHDVNIDMLSEICKAAAAKTNSISANFLTQCSKGLCSFALLELLNNYHINCDESVFLKSVNEVAKLGATSGSDILTGVYYSLKDNL